MGSQQQIIESIAESLALPVTDVDLESSLKGDLGLNPVEVADLLEHLTQRFHIVFDPSETENLRTIGDLVELIEDKLLE